ncbi:hypothetical protein [Burkholderia ubonensis]|uniref:hypothetical protein n=1 Tax=Burkholderia ubonensis TaxID=101571 RepID=UPI000A5E0E9A|nr:hypothetical protein [Burkholderia ubonensis]
MSLTEKYVRTNLTIAASGRFKNEVLSLALEKNMSLSTFVRDALCKAYPKLQDVNGYSEYALKRNIHLRQNQEATKKSLKSTDDEMISF